MLLLCSDQLRVIVAPDRVALVRLERRMRWRVAAHISIPCPQQQETMPAWEAALGVLRSALDRQNTSGRARVTIVVSNHFTRYAVIPWSDHLDSAMEIEAYCRHRFAAMFGEQADGWDIRWTRSDRGSPFLASAIDGAFLAQLNAMFLERADRLESVQPYLVTAFNATRKAVGARPCWLVFHEPGRLVICLLRNGRWEAIVSRQADATWPHHLPSIIARESNLIAMEQECREVVVHAPTMHGPLPIDDPYYHFELFRSDVRKMSASEDAGRLLMAPEGAHSNA